MGPVLQWTSQLVQTKLSKIVAVDMKSGTCITTDSIALNGQPFVVLSPDALHKHLDVRITMLGDFSAEKEHVLKKMRKAVLKEGRL